MRLSRLEEAVGRIDLILDEEAIMAYCLALTWRNEHYDNLDAEYLFRLAREIHAGNPDAFTEWEPVHAAELRYVRERATVWLSELPAVDRRRWVRMLAEIIGPVEEAPRG